MNKALLLLLVALVQCQSDGVFLSPPSSSDKFDENVEDFQVEDWDNSESPYSAVINRNYNQKPQTVRKRSSNDVLTRRSALDKNFMRFGRSSYDPPKYFVSSGAPETKTNFFRFGRGYKDNFIRFGRGAKDNFMRFGRGGKDSFIRFGRGETDDFLRSAKSGRENFIRFGKTDKNFMRFGRDGTETDTERENVDNQEYFSHLGDTTGKYDEILGGFERIVKSPGKPDNFIRFGKSGNQKERRNGTNFLRFGKKSETDESETEDFNSNVDSNEDALTYSPEVRVKRQTTDDITSQNGNKKVQKEDAVGKFKSNSGNDFIHNTKTSEGKAENILKSKFENPKAFEKRSIGFFEERPDDFPRRLFPVSSTSWQTLNNMKNLRSTPFFPISEFPNWNPNVFVMSRNPESKRDKGDSNFIRFG